MRDVTADVVLLKVEMQRAGDAWDVHLTVGTREPALTLGEFVMAGVKTPQEYEERLGDELREYVESLEGKSYQIVN